MKVSVFYTNFPNNIGGYIDFEVNVIDKCETAYTITTSSHPTLNYLVARPAANVIFDAFNVEPSYCILSYEFELTPALLAPDDTAIQMDSDTRTITIQTVNISIAGTYTITVIALTPGGFNSGVSFDMILNIVDPCLYATLTIDNTILPSPYNYIATQKADR